MWTTLSRSRAKSDHEGMNKPLVLPLEQRGKSSVQARKGEKKSYFHAFRLCTSQPMLFPAIPIITPAALQKGVTEDCPVGVSSSLNPGLWWGTSVYKV